MENESNKLTRAYSGTEITASILKDTLEQAGIGAVLKNETESGRVAGFGTPGGCDVYVMEKDVEKATPIVEEFIKRNS